MNDDITFGAWLKKRRAALGVTQEQFSARIGLSLAMLRKLESGERRPSSQVAALLATYFRITDSELEAFIAFARSEAAPPGDNSPPSFGSKSPWQVVRPRRSGLPVPLTRLIGRDAEVAHIRDQILNGKVRLLTLTGPPGIGKTRLALQAAASMAEQFDHSVYFVELSAIVDPTLVQATIARSLGLTEEPTRTLEEVLLDFVYARRMLLVLDNFEQVLDAALDVVNLLQAGADLKALVTSREALHVRGERTYIVPPLQVPDPHDLPDIDRLSNYPVVQLFIERTQSIQPDFTLDKTNSVSVVEICARLGGVPLSIELITARTRLFTPDALLARLNDLGDLALLSGNARDLPSRHRSLRSAIAWSYDLLDESEQSLFRRLSVFAGSFSTEAAASLCRGISDPFLDPAEILVSLLDKSLLSPADTMLGAQQSASAPSSTEARSSSPLHTSTPTPRFAMLETIREYALERLVAAQEEEIAQQLHAFYFMQLAEQAESKLSGNEQTAWLDRLNKEYDNLRSAFLWAKEAAEQSDTTPIGANNTQPSGTTQPTSAEVALRLAVALGHFWYIKGFYREGQEWLLEALQLPGAATPAL